MKGPQLSVFNFSIKNQTTDSVDINVDGFIVDAPTQEILQQYWGDQTSVSYKSFRDSIPDGIKTINLKVNSGGGHVGDAMAMHDYLQELESKGVTVNRTGIGIVASAATYLVMGQNSTLSENCLFMIHNVSGIAYGDVNQLENQVQAMRKFNDMITNFYCNKTGLSKTVVGNMMNAETWMTADEAKSKNFVTNVGNKVNLTNHISKDNWPFKNMAIYNTYDSFFTNTQTMDTKKITDTISAGFKNLIDKLGLKDKENDESIKNALKEFSDSIINATKGQVPAGGTKGQVLTKASDADYDVDWEDDNDSDEAENVKNMVNNAIEKSFESVPENLKAAINAAVKEGLKNAASKEDLKNEMKALTDQVIEKIGNQTNANDSEVPKDKKKVNNRFSKAYEDYKMN